VSGFTGVHKTLLGINSHVLTLEELLQPLQMFNGLSDLIDSPDLRGRSSLAWAVEYGMVDAVQTLSYSDLVPMLTNIGCLSMPDCPFYF
jgi:hypothetical protein